MLVSEKIVNRWYQKDHFIYQNFAYLYKNPLWDKEIPNGFSVCPYFWSAMLLSPIFRTMLVWPIIYLIKPMLKITGISYLDKFIINKLVKEDDHIKGYGIILFICMASAFIIIGSGFCFLIGAISHVVEFNLLLLSQSGVSNSVYVYKIASLSLITTTILSVIGYTIFGNDKKCKPSVYINLVSWTSFIIACLAFPHNVWNSIKINSNYIFKFFYITFIILRDFSIMFYKTVISPIFTFIWNGITKDIYHEFSILEFTLIALIVFLVVGMITSYIQKFNIQKTIKIQSEKYKQICENIKNKKNKRPKLNEWIEYLSDKIYYDHEFRKALSAAMDKNESVDFTDRYQMKYALKSYISQKLTYRLATSSYLINVADSENLGNIDVSVRLIDYYPEDIVNYSKDLSTKFKSFKFILSQDIFNFQYFLKLYYPKLILKNFKTENKETNCEKVTNLISNNILKIAKPIMIPVKKAANLIEIFLGFFVAVFILIKAGKQKACPYKKFQDSNLLKNNIEDGE
jgi:hypothetical protein